VPLAPFIPPTHTRSGAAVARPRLAVLAAVVGIAAAVLAYAISPDVRHAVTHAATSVRHAVTRVFHDGDRPKAPALPTEVLIGPRTTLAALRGHPALISFWTADSASGREAAFLARAARSAGGRGRIVGVGYDLSRTAARRFVAHHRWSFANLRDAHGTVGRRYGIRGARDVPVTFVLDAQGGIARTLRGPQSESALLAALRSAGR